jgi:hypothetical protein
LTCASAATARSAGTLGRGGWNGREPLQCSSAVLLPLLKWQLTIASGSAEVMQACRKDTETPPLSPRHRRPEIRHGNKPDQPYGEEARNYLDHLIGGVFSHYGNIFLHYRTYCLTCQMSLCYKTNENLIQFHALQRVPYLAGKNFMTDLGSFWLDCSIPNILR